MSWFKKIMTGTILGIVPPGTAAVVGGIKATQKALGGIGGKDNTHVGRVGQGGGILDVARVAAQEEGEADIELGGETDAERRRRASRGRVSRQGMPQLTSDTAGAARGTGLGLTI